jgi:hypothetical protein
MVPVFLATLVTSTLLFMLVEKPFSLVRTQRPNPLAATLPNAA